MSSPSFAFTIETPKGFDLRATVFGHGWVQLAPFSWEPGSATLTVLLRSVRKTPLVVRIKPARSGLTAMVDRAVSERMQSKIVQALHRILALDRDLTPLHSLCRASEGLEWIARGRFGRFLRAEDPFEDMAKVLLTTNCTWQQTKGLVRRISEGLGSKTACGRSAFPTPAQVLAGRHLFTEEVRLGYRTASLIELAERADELMSLDRWDAAVLEKTVRSFRGFGPYAARTMKMIVGTGGPPVIDSWALARGREKFGADLTARDLERRYACFLDLGGAVAWFDLNEASFRARVSPGA